MVDPKIQSWTGGIVSGTNLDATTYGQGTSFPSTWNTLRLFFRTDEGYIYRNTGTEASPVFTVVSGTEPIYGNAENATNLAGSITSTVTQNTSSNWTTETYTAYNSYAGLSTLPDNGTGSSHSGSDIVGHVRQFKNFVLNSGSTITATRPTGAEGWGIFIFATDKITINGVIDVSGQGSIGGIKGTPSSATNTVSTQAIPSTAATQGYIKQGVVGGTSTSAAGAAGVINFAGTVSGGVGKDTNNDPATATPSYKYLVYNTVESVITNGSLYGSGGGSGSSGKHGESGQGGASTIGSANGSGGTGGIGGTGGNGGDGGGYVVLVAPEIEITGTINVGGEVGENGGNGGTGTDGNVFGTGLAGTAGEGAGGGSGGGSGSGGNGGFIGLVYKTTLTQGSATYTISGGAAGTPGSGGSGGSNQWINASSQTSTSTSGGSGNAGSSGLSGTIKRVKIII